MENNTNTLPTFEEYIQQKFGHTPSGSLDVIDLGQEYAVLFAKHHVQECKEAIKEKAKLKVFTDHNIESLPKEHIMKVHKYEDANEFDTKVVIDPDSIENAYSEDNIK